MSLVHGQGHGRASGREGVATGALEGRGVQRANVFRRAEDAAEGRERLADGRAREFTARIIAKIVFARACRAGRVCGHDVAATSTGRWAYWRGQRSKTRLVMAGHGRRDWWFWVRPGQVFWRLVVSC